MMKPSLLCYGDHICKIYEGGYYQFSCRTLLTFQEVFILDNDLKAGFRIVLDYAQFQSMQFVVFGNHLLPLL